MNWWGCVEGQGKQALNLYSGVVGSEKRESPSY